ncbi:unnamed protein product [Arctogadus glacialis]
MEVVCRISREWGRQPHPGGPELTVDDLVFVRIFKRRWAPPKVKGPGKILAATSTAVRVNGIGPWRLGTTVGLTVVTAWSGPPARSFLTSHHKRSFMSAADTSDQRSQTREAGPGSQTREAAWPRESDQRGCLAQGVRPERLAQGVRPERLAQGVRPERLAQGVRPERLAQGVRPGRLAGGADQRSL